MVARANGRSNGKGDRAIRPVVDENRSLKDISSNERDQVLATEIGTHGGLQFHVAEAGIESLPL